MLNEWAKQVTEQQPCQPPPPPPLDTHKEPFSLTPSVLSALSKNSGQLDILLGEPAVFQVGLLSLQYCS